MQDFEIEALELANELISEFGKAVDWVQVVDGAPADNTKPWKPGASVPTHYSPVLVRLPTNRKTMAFLEYLTGTDVPTGYERAIMAGNVPFTPSLKDYFVDGGKNVGIIWLDAFKPAGNVLLWTMGLRP